MSDLQECAIGFATQLLHGSDLNLGRLDEDGTDQSNGLRALDVERLVFVQQALNGGKQVVTQILNLVFHGVRPF